MSVDFPASAGWRDFPRYPDPAVEVLDERFAPIRIFSAAVERLYTGCRWAEGPVWFGDGRYLLWSDIPNQRILKWAFYDCTIKFGHIQYSEVKLTYRHRTVGCGNLKF